MTLAAFIKKNRKEIDKGIRAKLGGKSIETDHERRLWLLNDADLYGWAKAQGVDFEESR